MRDQSRPLNAQELVILRGMIALHQATVKRTYPDPDQLAVERLRAEVGEKAATIAGLKGRIQELQDALIRHPPDRSEELRRGPVGADI